MSEIELQHSSSEHQSNGQVVLRASEPEEETQSESSRGQVGGSQVSAFGCYRSALGTDATSQRTDEQEVQYDRTSKVPRTGYSDHGDHGKVTTANNLLKKIVYNVKDTYGLLEGTAQTDTSKNGKKRYSPTDADRVRPHPSDNTLASTSRTATSAPLGSGGSVSTANKCGCSGDHSISNSCKLQHHETSPKQHKQHNTGGSLNNSPGQSSSMSSSAPLSSRPMSNSSAISMDISENTATRAASSAFDDTPKKGGLLQSIMEGESSIDPSSAKLRKESTDTKGTKIDRICLTNPCTPWANNDLDNKDGNLIVFEGDIFSIPLQAIRFHTSAIQESSKEMLGTWESASLQSGSKADFRVVGLLGQGTFAQVFKCKNLKTGKMVAVKVVKNKVAYTKQAAIEIDVFRAMANGEQGRGNDCMVSLLCYFMHHDHLCLVFELLGMNLYEVLKRRQFIGLPLPTVRGFVQQALDGVKNLCKHRVVHCDLKPENILLVDETAMDSPPGSGRDAKNKSYSPEDAERKDAVDGSVSKAASCSSRHSRCAAHRTPNLESKKIKLIDFGSACFEGRTAHTYIQSRFYRCPEVLVGLPYDSAIDIWSLGCVAAELFLGLPILPGVHEHDQLGRVCEMIEPLPEWMVEQGTKSSKYFVLDETRIDSTHVGPSWRLKSRQEFIRSLSEEEKRKRGGIEKLEKPANRYFRNKKLRDILILHGERHCSTPEEKEMLVLFVHFLKGVLDPDPWNRWTAYQASMHPFITGDTTYLKDGRTKKSCREQGNFDVNWSLPADPSIYQRKINAAQKASERQQQQQLLRGSRAYGNSANRTAMSRMPSSTMTPECTEPALLADMMRRARSMPAHMPHNMATLPGIESPPLAIGLPNANSGLGHNSGFVNMAGSLGTGLGGSHLQSALLASQGMSGVSDSLMGGHSFVEGYNTVMAPPPSLLGQSRGYIDRNADISASLMSHQGFSQSFSGVSYVGMGNRQIPADEDFGYALQRPGVVPRVASELPIATNQFQQTPHHQRRASSRRRQYASSFAEGTLGHSPSMQPGQSLMYVGSPMDSLQPLFNAEARIAQRSSSIEECHLETEGQAPMPVLMTSLHGVHGAPHSGSLLAQQLAEHAASQNIGNGKMGGDLLQQSANANISSMQMHTGSQQHGYISHGSEQQQIYMRQQQQRSLSLGGGVPQGVPDQVHVSAAALRQLQTHHEQAQQQGAVSFQDVYQCAGIAPLQIQQMRGMMPGQTSLLSLSELEQQRMIRQQHNLLNCDVQNPMPPHNGMSM